MASSFACKGVSHQSFSCLNGNDFFDPHQHSLALGGRKNDCLEEKDIDLSHDVHVAKQMGE